MSSTETGIVKWFNEKKGFGFIMNDAGEDVFVHYREIKGDGFKTLHENERVSFIVDRGPKGLKAREVALAEEKVQQASLS